MKIKKYMLFYLTILSVFNLVTPTYAAPVIDPNEKGSITIQKYASDSDINQIPATGEEQTITDLQPLQNITFTITRVLDTDTSANTATILEDENAYTATLKTNEYGKAVFNNLAQGVYLIHEHPNDLVEAPVDDFLVQIPMTNPTGTDWIYDVYVYPKNQLIGGPTINSFVGSLTTQYQSVNLGDDITWHIDATLPNDITTAKNYQINLSLNQYLPYLTDSFVAYGANSQNNQTVSLTLDEDYFLDYQSQSLSFQLTPSGQTKLSDTESTTRLHIHYDTTLNIPETELENTLATKLSNEIKLFYTNALNASYEISPPQENQAYIYTGGINILKVDGRDNNTYLEGATFNIYHSLDDAKNGNNPILAPNGDSVWRVSTNKQGNASFYGLAFGEDGSSIETATSTYYLVEIQAPTGYNLLANPYEITVNYTSHLEGNMIRIDNYSGFTLPITGGTGTFIFMIVGTSLIFIAIYLLYKSTRKKNNDI